MFHIWKRWGSRSRGWVAIVGIFFSLGLQGAERQWMLRFNEARSRVHLQTGCYGTASYQWIGADIETLRANREGLHQYALQHGVNGLVWSSTRDTAHPGNYFAYDLETNEAISSAQLPLAKNKALVFCLCRKVNLVNCTAMNLPPLGNRESFFLSE